MIRLAVVMAVVAAVSTPVPVEAQEGPLAIPDTLSPSGDGLVLRRSVGDDVSVPFGRTQAEVGKFTQRFWREPESRGTMAECGAGPIDFQDFSNGLRLHFQDEAFVGWALGPGQVLATMPDGIQTGATRGALDLAVYELDVFESSLGTEFATPAGIYGVFSGPDDAAVVEYLWAGTNCIFR